MKPISWAERLRYRVDNAIARGPSVLIWWLVGLGLVLVVLAAIILIAGRLFPVQDGKPLGVFQQFWKTLLHFLDNGQFSADDPANGLGYMAVMMVITLVGLLFSALLIGILSNGIASRLEAMRKGRSRVVEQGHTVILGWSPHVYTAVSELIEANANHRGHSIALLAAKDKVEMEDSLQGRVGQLRSTRLVCRSGLPMDLTDLAIANPFAAKAVIVLAPSPEDSPADPDAEVIKTVLALANYPGRPKTKLHIVAELRSKHNLEAARLAGGEETRFVLADDLIARITAQTCRQSGLSVVISELLSFQGNEVYFAAIPGLAGQTFAQALFAFEDSALIGLRRENGQIVLCPPSDTPITAGDQVIAIASDDDQIRTRPAGKPDESALRLAERAPARPEHTLIIGWNARGSVIVEELERMVAQGSKLTVLVQESQRVEVESLAGGLSVQTLEVKVGDATNPKVLQGLHLGAYQHLITLGDTSLGSGMAGIQAADAHTLVTLLHLRQIKQGLNQPFAVVSEMLDPRNRELAEVAQADDFIVSDRLVSLAVTQIAENPQLAEVWGELLDAAGVTIYLRSASEYVGLGQEVDFYTLLEAARRRDEVAIGYRLKAQSEDAAQNYGVRVNPNKAQRLRLADGDKLIVLGRA